LLALLRYYYNNCNKCELQDSVKSIPPPTKPANYTASYSAKYRVIFAGILKKGAIRDGNETVHNNRQIIFNDKTKNDT
jgi:hypothetical protein